MMVGYTKLYSHRQKADISFKITDEKNLLLLGGCHKLPCRKMYWETTPDTFVQTSSESLPCNMFDRFVATTNVINRTNFLGSFP